MTALQKAQFKMRSNLERIRPKVDIDRCIVEDDCLTLRIFNPHFEDDRNNVIDLEGMSFKEAVNTIQHKAAIESDDELYTLYMGVATIIYIELKAFI